MWICWWDKAGNRDDDKRSLNMPHSCWAAKYGRKWHSSNKTINICRMSRSPKKKKNASNSFGLLFSVCFVFPASLQIVYSPDLLSCRLSCPCPWVVGVHSCACWQVTVLMGLPKLPCTRQWLLLRLTGSNGNVLCGSGLVSLMKNKLLFMKGLKSTSWWWVSAAAPHLMPAQVLMPVVKWEFFRLNNNFLLF